MKGISALVLAPALAGCFLPPSAVYPEVAPVPAPTPTPTAPTPTAPPAAPQGLATEVDASGGQAALELALAEGYCYDVVVTASEPVELQIASSVTDDVVLYPTPFDVNGADGTATKVVCADFAGDLPLLLTVFGGDDPAARFAVTATPRLEGADERGARHADERRRYEEYFGAICGRLAQREDCLARLADDLARRDGIAASR